MAIIDETIYGLKGKQITQTVEAIKENASDIAGLETTIAGKQDALSATQLTAVNSGIDTTKVGQIATNASDIDAVESKIPAQATSSNQLADKDFVNSSVATNTANFVGTFNTIEELEAVQNPTNNDYGFVVGSDQAGNTVYNRYKFNGTAWVFEYALNNSSFTADQWAAIQSGITAGLVTKLNNIEAGAEVNDIDSISVNGTAVTPDANKNVDLAIPNSDFSGATSSTAGTHGLVPAPVSGETDKYLKSDGSWATVSQYSLPAATAATLGGVKIGTNLSMDANDVLSATDTTYTSFTGATASTAGTTGLVPAPAAGDESKFLKADGTWETVQAGPTVVQTTGTSTTDVMSQGASHALVYADWYRTDTTPNMWSANNNAIRIGQGFGQRSSSGTYEQGNYSVLVGTNGTARGSFSVHIGSGGGSSTGNNSLGFQTGKADGQCSVAFYGGDTSTQGVFTIGLDRSYAQNYGYNNSAYRLLTGVYDPQSDHDAATKGYVDNIITMTDTDPGEGAALAANHFIAYYE